MFSINLHRDEIERRRKRTGRMPHLALVVALLGVEFVLVGVNALSGVLLRERVGRLSGEVQRLARGGEASDAPDDEAMQAARELLALRAHRVEWTPKLVALSELGDASLRLTDLSAQAPARGRPGTISVTGVVSHASEGIEPVTVYLGRLRSDPRFLRDFQNIRLGTMEKTALGKFVIVCESPRAGT